MTCGYRDFPGRRWLVVFLRAAHLAGVVGVGAGLLAGAAAAAGPFAELLVISGVLMAALDAWSNPVWLREFAGLSLLLKLALLLWFAADEAARPALFWSILVFSAIFSHAPASFRHRQL
ncbi:hypothetical protein [Zoogloea dura]|uniref:Uncharacterized protein n=1 Tax=Zoogloea dura TaxID=2728840 RepID=A0A848GC13_9RHOO|nr:hypothetical protein [Zoogloea dura]NML28672.1 hypothetical protein [Zoogloea dura]